MTSDMIEGYNLSPQQKHLWWLSEGDDTSAFRVRSAILIEGALDRAALSHALGQIVGRHTILRSAFRQIGTAAPMQVVLADSGAPAIRQHDLGPLDEREQARVIADLALVERPADSVGAPLRLDLARLGPDRHILSIALSALCADALSLTQLIREISQAYAAGVSGQALPPAEIVQYADAAEVFNDLIDSEDTAAGRDYWRQQKSQLAALLTPLAQAVGPLASPWRPAVIEVAVPAATAAALGPLAESAGADVATVFQAAWLAQINRLSGQDEIVVAVAYDGRGYEGLDTAVGLFARYLPIRHQLPRSLGFAAAVAQIKERLENAVEWQEYFIWDHLAQRPDGAGPRPALCAYGFDSTELPAPWQAGGLGWSVARHSAHSERFHLRLAVSHCAGAWSMAFHYDPALFTADEIERIAARQLTLLENAAARPEAAIGAIDLLPAPERRLLLADLNATAQTYPRTAVAHGLFEEQARRTPDRTAVAFQDQAITYAELNRRANQLAGYLRRQGVGPDTLVGLCIDRSPAMVVGVLAILKAGGAYVPLDRSYPAERRTFILADTGAQIVLTQRQLADEFSQSGAQIVSIDADWPAIEQESGANPAVAVDPNNLAYVIYTSGSTGQPKGALIHHQGLVNYLSWATRCYPVGEGRGSLVHSPIGFDLTVTSLLVPLVAGQTAILVPEDEGIDGLNDRLRSEGDFSLIKLTPTHLDVLNRLFSGAEFKGKARALVIGGEALLAEHIAPWLEHAPETMIINEYGPTETVVGCCVYQASAGSLSGGSIPIGRPIANTQLYVLDEQGRLAPFGVPGELYIGGDGVARGYLNRPTLTAERFVPDPFGASGGRLYKTGDLVRYRADGDLEFLGRNDHQVKIHGFRIELGEVDAALLGHESVREAVVVAREVEYLPGDKRLVAYVALNAGYGEDDAALRAFLATILPEYMAPAAFVFVDALPLTPNGKIDRQALPALRRKLASAADMVAPRTPVEEKLAAIWCEVLQLPAVGMHDNFFALGGDSILSIQIVAKASNAGLQLKPNALFTHRTVAELASVVNAAPAISAEQGLVEGDVPLTPAQALFVASDIAEPHHWNQTLLFELRERLDIAALEQAAQQLILHHDALRMRFGTAAGAWSQRNAGAEDQTVCSLVDLGALAATEQAAALEQAAAAAQRSLDLANGPLFRAVLFDLGPSSRQRLLLTIHHLVVDGVSWRILLEDLQAAYAQVLQGQAVRLPAKTSSYKRWAERLAAHAQSPELAGEASYWLDLGRRSAALPTDHAAQPGDNLVGSEQTVAAYLPAAETQSLLQEVPSAYQTTINDALLTALSMACVPWIGTPALSLYLEGHGREELFADIDLSRTVGWFTALYPVDLALPALSGPGEALKAIKEQLRRVPQRGIGYGLLRYLSGDRRLAGLPEPQLCFNYLGQLDQAIATDSMLALAAESTGPSRSPRGRRLFVLEVNAALVGGQLQVEWTFSDRFHQRQTIERLAERFIGELRALIQHCQSPTAGGYTPSDFPDEDLNDSDLDAILAQIGDF